MSLPFSSDGDSVSTPFRPSLPPIYGATGGIAVFILKMNQRTIGPENAHLKPDLGVLSHNEMTLTLNTHTPLLTS